jgi:hypothetical protein
VLAKNLARPNAQPAHISTINFRVGQSELEERVAKVFDEILKEKAEGEANEEEKLSEEREAEIKQAKFTEAQRDAIIEILKKEATAFAERL